MFEDDFPFPKVGYVSSLEGMYFYIYIYIYLELQTTIDKWLFHLMIANLYIGNGWKSPNILSKWLFGVPGIYIYHWVVGSANS